jgi:hypothetical protein
MSSVRRSALGRNMARAATEIERLLAEAGVLATISTSRLRVHDVHGNVEVNRLSADLAAA